MNSIMMRPQSSAFDSLEPTFSCKLASQLRANYTGSYAKWTDHLKASSEVYDKLDAVSGIPRADDGGWHT